jgi:hypothetical protein
MQVMSFYLALAIGSCSGQLMLGGLPGDGIPLPVHVIHTAGIEGFKDDDDPQPAQKSKSHCQKTKNANCKEERSSQNND